METYGSGAGAVLCRGPTKSRARAAEGGNEIDLQKARRFPFCGDK